MVSQSATEHIGNFRPLRSNKFKAIYDAPGQMKKKANVLFSDDLNIMWCDGVILDMVHSLGGLDDRELRCQSFVCAEDGHVMLQSEVEQQSGPRATMLSMDWLDSIVRSLVLDRRDKYLCFHAPPKYITDFIHLCNGCIAEDPVDWSFATWFEQNRYLKFGTQTLEDLIRNVPSETPSSPPPLRRPPSYPIRQLDDAESDKVDTFLSRFHDTVRKKARRLMTSCEGLVGMAPCRARPGDVVAILFGCNIPLILRDTEGQDGWQVIGEAYAHGFMAGEVTDLIKRGKKKTRRFRLI